MNRSLLTFLLFMLLLCPTHGFSQSRSGQSGSGVSFPNKPTSANFFVDEAQLIDLSDREQINQLAGNLLREEGVALFVVTIPSLLSYGAGHMNVEDYSRELFDSWGIGAKARNYGMLLLVSRDDRRARIELGADFGHSRDAEAQQIMDTLIVPQFRSGNFSGGILAGARGLNAMARGLALPKPEVPWWYLPAMIAGLFLFVGIIISLFRSGQSGWGWALIAVLGAVLFFILRATVASSGSGGGFGGGSSGGGGASGSW